MTGKYTLLSVQKSKPVAEMSDVFLWRRSV